MCWKWFWMQLLQRTLQGYTPRILHHALLLHWLRLKLGKLARVKLVGKHIALAMLICYKYKTALAPTLSEYSPTARMSGKQSWDTTRAWMEALGSGNAPRWSLQLRYKNMIKKFIFLTLLRSRYHVGFSKGKHWVRKYFWSLKSAEDFARNCKDLGKTTVWRRDWKRMFTHNNLVDYSIHEDAKNFSTNI